MVSLFIKGFTAKHSDDESKRSVTGKICGLFGILLNVVLFVLKFLCGTLTGSISITADAFNNLSDAGSSIISLVGFRLAEKRPDPDHPFGHGRMEYVSGLIVSSLILLMGFELLKTSITGLIEPIAPGFGVLTAVVLAVSVAVKLYIFAYNRKYGKMIDSATMKATALDSLGDAFATTLVLISSVVCYFTDFAYLDPICGLGVSAFIFIAGIRSARETVSPLLGQPPSAEFVKKVEQIALSEPLVIGLHDMIVHDYGPGRVMVSLHCEVSSEENVITLHEAIDGVEGRIMSELNCMATIHMDPVDLNDEVLAALRVALPDIVKNINENATYHDLRTVRAAGHINVIFDVLLPAGAIVNKKTATEYIQSQIISLIGNAQCIINFDTDYLSRT